MADAPQSINILRQASSVALLLTGTVVLYGVTLGVVGSLCLQPTWPDGTFWLLSLVTGAVAGSIAWGGAALWHRWRLPFGVILLLLSAFTLPKAVGVLASAGQAVGAQATRYVHLAACFTALAILLFLVAIALIVIDVRRHKRKQVSL